MGKPGSGRYTDYIPSENTASSPFVSIATKSLEGYKRRWGLFNKNAAGKKGVIYGGEVATPDNATVIAAVDVMAKILVPSGLQVGDTKMFGAGVNMNFGTAPDVSKVTFKSSNDASTISIGNGPLNDKARPAHAYMPNPLSPGASADSSVNLEASIQDPELGASGKITDPGYKATGPNTISPSETAANIASLGQDLAMGTSKPQ